MKNVKRNFTIGSLALTFILSSFLISSNLYGQTGNIEVNVYNIPKVTGSIYIALYDDKKKERFPFEESVRSNYCAKVTSKYCSYTIKNLPYGEYAVVVYHDKNADGKCNRFLGIPTEDVGFSNNIRPKFSAPDFDDNKVLLDKKELSIFIKLD